MEPFIEDAAQLRAAATRADALARRAQRAADEAFRVFLRDDGAASPDQAVETAKSSARAAQEAWRKYVKHIAQHGAGGAPQAPASQGAGASRPMP
jgi:sulfur relay (sulfurtransferase) complex TusBCD TusD component (DsrE family)